MKAVTPTFTTATVEEALLDAEHLIGSRPARSAVDRVHMAFHGYLMSVCGDAKLSLPNQPTLVQLLSTIREHHPAFAGDGARSQDIRKIIRTLGAIADALNPLRNNASLAHPNDDLLDDPEAMLVINTVRTLLNYIDARLQASVAQAAVAAAD